MNIDAYSTGDLVEFAFFAGLGAGLLISYLMCAIVWRWCAAYKVAEIAARMAEKAALDAEIRVDQARLERGKLALISLFKSVDQAEDARDKAVSQ